LNRHILANRDDDARLQRRIDALALRDNLKQICRILVALGRPESDLRMTEIGHLLKIEQIPKVIFQIGALPKSNCQIHRPDFNISEEHGLAMHLYGHAAKTAKGPD
jgi:hypothetical protein